MLTNSRRWNRALGATAALAAAAALVVGFAPIGPRNENFSQYPGFAEYFAAHPSTALPPSAQDRALLSKYRPRFHLPAGHAGLISFYDDYVAEGVLYDADGTVLSARVTRALLNARKDASAVVFRHEPKSGSPPRAVVFGRVDRANVELAGEGPRVFTFLTYHAVFRHSGLAAGLVGWQGAVAALVADLDDWHQLDHYTAVSVVLDEAQVPVALLVQQHNSRRTYLLGETYDLPEDGRPAMDVAIRSNELYPHAEGRRRHKIIPYQSADGMKYLLGLAERPFISANDITEPAAEAGYELRFLAPSDAFYTFKGFLGEKRMLPGRSGPPGADYNTLPAHKPWGRQLLFGYWRPGHQGDAQRLIASLEAEDGDWADAFIRLQAAVFADNLDCARRRREGCGFR